MINLSSLPRRDRNMSEKIEAFGIYRPLTTGAMQRAGGLLDKAAKSANTYLQEKGVRERFHPAPALGATFLDPAQTAEKLPELRRRGATLESLTAALRKRVAGQERIPLQLELGVAEWLGGLLGLRIAEHTPGARELRHIRNE